MMLYQIVLADATLVFKKKDPLKKTNYRPASVLPPVSKLFERLMQKQTNKKSLSPYLCEYRKGFSTQHYHNFVITYIKLEKNS